MECFNAQYDEDPRARSKREYLAWKAKNGIAVINRSVGKREEKANGNTQILQQKVEKSK